MESVFGYISVLPGAFSAYRYEALLGKPLEQYFHQLTTSLEDSSPFFANMYLAEDRILCYELVAKKDKKYLLRYVNGAIARTDVPEKLTALIKQRRRWLNGSLFALVYAIMHWKNILTEAKHGCGRKLMFIMQFAFFIVNLILNWFSVAVFYTLYFHVATSVIHNGVAFTLARYLFIGLIMLQFVLGLGNKPHRISVAYNISAILFGLIMYFTLGVAIYQLIVTPFSYYVLVAVASVAGSILLLGFLYRSAGVIILNWIQTTFYAPTWIVIFPIYSLCNTHDVSWGTKDLEKVNVSDISQIIKANAGRKSADQYEVVLRQIRERKSKLKGLVESAEARFERFRSLLLLIWALTNGLFVGIFTSSLSYDIVREFQVYYIQAMFFAVAGIAAIKTLFSVLYLFTSPVSSKNPKYAYPEHLSA